MDMQPCFTGQPSGPSFCRGNLVSSGFRLRVLGGSLGDLVSR